MDSLASQIICNILVKKMRLSDQNVWVRDQNKKIPDGTGIFIAVGCVGWKPIAVNTLEESIVIPKPDPQPDISTLKEIITTIAQEYIQIDIMSRDNAALMRQMEILSSLASTYSIQQQEKNSFKIFRLPIRFDNTSFAEGGSMLNRFSITIAANVWYRKEEILALDDIFDSFETRVDDEETIGTEHGIIEFTIDQNTEI